MPKVLSFFSGAMGLDLAFEQEGFEIISVCENDKACQKTIKANRPDIELIDNIGDYHDIIEEFVDTEKISKDIDVIIGGPPCQSFSTAGKRESDMTCIEYFLDIAGLIKPKFVVMENVRGLLSAKTDDKSVMAHIINVFESHGYGVSFNLYNAANFGSPQKRERVILVASKDGKKLPYLTPTHIECHPLLEYNGLIHQLSHWRSFWNVTGGIQTCNYLQFSESRLKYFAMLKEGQNWRDLPIDVQKECMGNINPKTGGNVGYFRRLAWHEPTPTLMTNPTMKATALCHPEELRPLSIEEYKRVQEFPDDWKIEGSLADQYRQVGNAVPLGLGRAAARLIKQYMNGEEIISYDNFRYSRYSNTSDKDWINDMGTTLKKPEKEGTMVAGVMCKQCGDLVFSRARHDYRKCTCGSIAVDGGFDYMRIIGEEENVGQINTFEIKQTKKELFADWNSGKNKYGIIKGALTLKEIIFGKQEKEE